MLNYKNKNMSIEELKQKIKELLVGLSSFEIDEILQDLKFEIRKESIFNLPVSK